MAVENKDKNKGQEVLFKEAVEGFLADIEKSLEKRNLFEFCESKGDKGYRLVLLMDRMIAIREELKGLTEE